jgi:hypothetical protein
MCRFFGDRRFAAIDRHLIPSAVRQQQKAPRDGVAGGLFFSRICPRG